MRSLFRVPFAAIACLVVALGNVAAQADGVLTLATTTSTENSGLLAHIHPDFERRTGIRVKVVAKGTGASLQLARDGNADVVLVHAREQEDQFVAEGYGVMRRDVMVNDFVILGAASDPAKIGGSNDAAAALKAIAASRASFVSRGDGSGTHLKEQQLWRATGLALQTKSIVLKLSGGRKEFQSLRPAGDWYLSIGQGMGKTIILTTEKQAYTLADRGTYSAFALANPPRTDMEILCQGDPRLDNPYGVIAVDPDRHSHVNFDAAKTYIEWITSARVQQMIGRYAVGGKILFHPHAAGTPAPSE